MHSRVRSGCLLMAWSLLALAGCGRALSERTFTNENTPVRVVTDEEMQKMHEANERISSDPRREKRLQDEAPRRLH